jgi:hypothetical protein
LWAGALTAAAVATAAPAQAMPLRFAEQGTILMCEGDRASAHVIDTNLASAWSVGVLVGDVDAIVNGDTGLLVGERLAWTGPIHDPDTGSELGQLVVDGSIVRGETEVLSGWDVNEDGQRYSLEGSRTALSGSMTLSLDGTSTTLDCTGWEVDTETFQLDHIPAGDRYEGWSSEAQALEGGAGTIGFYGERETELGISLDLVAPYAFAGERLQVRNGTVDGSLLLRDPETWSIIGVADVEGTVTKVATEQVVEISHGYRRVEDIDLYEVSVTIRTSSGEWSGTWDATHTTMRLNDVYPPKAI